MSYFYHMLGSGVKNVPMSREQLRLSQYNSRRITTVNADFNKRFCMSCQWCRSVRCGNYLTVMIGKSKIYMLCKLFRPLNCFMQVLMNLKSYNTTHFVVLVKFEMDASFVIGTDVVVKPSSSLKL